MVFNMTLHLSTSVKSGSAALSEVLAIIGLDLRECCPSPDSASHPQYVHPHPSPIIQRINFVGTNWSNESNQYTKIPEKEYRVIVASSPPAREGISRDGTKDLKHGSNKGHYDLKERLRG